MLEEQEFFKTIKDPKFEIYELVYSILVLHGCDIDLAKRYKGFSLNHPTKEDINDFNKYIYSLTAWVKQRSRVIDNILINC